MQSDLDIIFVKLDNNLNSLSELVNSDGFLLSNANYAIVVSRPGPGASRDDIKFYVKDLLCRFKIGRVDMKKQAIVSFTQVIQEEGERYVKIAMKIDGLVHVLLKFLNSKEVGIQEEALKYVAVIYGFDSYKSVLVGIGVVAPSIRVLETGSDLGKELSTRCLMKVTANSDNVWYVSAHGGVSALLKICGGSGYDDAGGELVGLACGVFRVIGRGSYVCDTEQRERERERRREKEDE
ncbi:hypothetical protein L6452_33237 [Arctium lappa]|uniref:Uncharacterized protein n=1 Tax=Arctium lappa TaxID=4217 RepID=A0ACB8Z757_ARCLA|nr:hypothetical protein L6452_33237 [Arctium lappa]